MIYCNIQNILYSKYCITHGPIAYYRNKKASILHTPSVNLQFIKGGMKNVPVFKATVSADLIDGDIKIAVVPDDAEFPEGADFFWNWCVTFISTEF